MWEAKREEREKREKGIKKETEREAGGERERGEEGPPGMYANEVTNAKSLRR